MIPDDEQTPYNSVLKQLKSGLKQKELTKGAYDASKDLFDQTVGYYLACPKIGEQPSDYWKIEEFQTWVMTQVNRIAAELEANDEYGKDGTKLTRKDVERAAHTIFEQAKYEQYCNELAKCDNAAARTAPEAGGGSVCAEYFRNYRSVTAER